MSASASKVSEQQRKSKQTNPRSLANLRPFKAGQSGNPGGTRKGFVYPTAAYERLGAMTPNELRKFSPPSAIEAAIKEAILRMIDGEAGEAHQALKELTDRVEGKAEQKKTVNESRTITVIFEKPEFANHDTDTTQSASEDTSGIQALQRACVRATLREITVGALPADRDES